MKHLKRIEAGIDTGPIRDALACNEDLWHLDASRQRTIGVQNQTQTIYLRRAVRDLREPFPLTQNVHASELAPHAWRLPEAVLLCQALADDVGVELGRAMLVRLPPGASVGTHRDDGAYYAIRDRYHLVVDSEPKGSILGVDDERAEMEPGELWRFDNKQYHWARNLGSIDRIHLIFDVLPHVAARAPSIPSRPR